MYRRIQAILLGIGALWLLAQTAHAGSAGGDDIMMRGTEFIRYVCVDDGGVECPYLGDVSPPISSANCPAPVDPDPFVACEIDFVEKDGAPVVLRGELTIVADDLDPNITNPFDSPPSTRVAVVFRFQLNGQSFTLAETFAADEAMAEPSIGVWREFTETVIVCGEGVDPEDCDAQAQATGGVEPGGGSTIFDLLEPFGAALSETVATELELANVGPYVILSVQVTPEDPSDDPADWELKRVESDARTDFTASVVVYRITAQFAHPASAP